jgi:hypothetical protein
VPPTASIRSSSLGGAPSGVVLYLNIPEIAGAQGLRRSQRVVSVSVGSVTGGALLDVDADEPNSPRH